MLEPDIDPHTWEYIGKGTSCYRLKFKKEKHPRIEPDSARTVRDLFATGQYTYLEISEMMCIALPDVVAIMDGAIHPYAGGVLKRHPVGLCTKELTSRRDKEFCFGCFEIALKAFPFFQFDIICEFNGMSPKDITDKLQENPYDSQDLTPYLQEG